MYWKLLLRRGSAPKAGSSWVGARSIGAPVVISEISIALYQFRADGLGTGWDDIPLFQRPTRRAPNSSLPFAGGGPGMGFAFKKASNSGTSWLRNRKDPKLPSKVQDGRFTVSLVRPQRITPCCTTSCPGLGFVSTPSTAGWEIPSRKPKLCFHISFRSVHLKDMYEE